MKARACVATPAHSTLASIETRLWQAPVAGYDPVMQRAIGQHSSMRLRRIVHSYAITHKRQTVCQFKMEITFAIIKPDAVRRYYTGDIIKRIESSGLHISGMRLIHLTRGQAEAFYDVHKDRPFFGSLCDYMTVGAGSGDGAEWRGGSVALAATDGRDQSD